MTMTGVETTPKMLVNDVDEVRLEGDNEVLNSQSHASRDSQRAEIQNQDVNLCRITCSTLVWCVSIAKKDTLTTLRDVEGVFEILDSWRSVQQS